MCICQGISVPHNSILRVIHRNHMCLFWFNELQGRKIESMSIIVVHERNVHTTYTL